MTEATWKAQRMTELAMQMGVGGKDSRMEKQPWQRS